MLKKDELLALLSLPSPPASRTNARGVPPVKLRSQCSLVVSLSQPVTCQDPAYETARITRENSRAETKKKSVTRVSFVDTARCPPRCAALRSSAHPFLLLHHTCANKPSSRARRSRRAVRRRRRLLRLAVRVARVRVRVDGCVGSLDRFCVRAQTHEAGQCLARFQETREDSRHSALPVYLVLPSP